MTRHPMDVIRECKAELQREQEKNEDHRIFQGKKRKALEKILRLTTSLEQVLEEMNGEELEEVAINEIRI